MRRDWFGGNYKAKRLISQVAEGLVVPSRW